MSDKIQDDAMLSEEEKINFGEKLKLTRENMGLSVQEAAARLHLSPRFITMLEGENLLHSSLPLIYLRGYLRSYTRLLSIPEIELAHILEKLDPKPITLALAPASSDSLSVPFPLEGNPYYARIATFLISLALLISITTWWYLHANAVPSTVIALKQPLSNPESALKSSSEEASQATPLPLNNTILANAAVTAPETEQAQVPEVALNLGTPKPVTLATAATVVTPNNTASKPTPTREEIDDDSADEQE